MDKPTIKGDEVRQGKIVYLDGLSKQVIDSFDNVPLSEAILDQLNHGHSPITPLTAKEVMEMYKKQGELAFCIRLRTDDDTCIGACRFGNISWQARHAQLSIGIVSEAHFSSEILADVIQTALQFAYWEANLNRIAVHCIEDNLLLKEALEQSHFTNEGRIRQEVYRDGKYLNKFVYSILQGQWSS